MNLTTALGEIIQRNFFVDLLVIINALDRCPSEAVNTKILNFFVDLLSGDFSCPTFNEKLLRKFISFDLICLSKWLEFRLLGRSTKDESGNHWQRPSSCYLIRKKENIFLIKSNLQKVR
ncbi:hypothetical protein ZOSMA_10116G00010 [Zostera marina]|uniref:Uncharacterized protein n=1 Tax=Zostera marina TaxID=29655 RepID=A0A0K9Q5M5_ZOSMR|nr:hypothetical protein ZOSMA_10116G00010 [Zostera marina]